VTLETFLMQQEGLDPARVKAILDSVQHFIGVIKTEMPRIEKLLTDINSQIAAYGAKQKEYSQWR